MEKGKSIANIFVLIFQEADTKSEIDTQAIHWRKHLWSGKEEVKESKKILQIVKELGKEGVMSLKALDCNTILRKVWLI